MNCKTITQLTETIYVIFEKVCQEINNHHAIREEKLIDDITNYMNENYGNPNISIAGGTAVYMLLVQVVFA